MYQFGEKRPVLFEIILIIAAFLAAAVFTVGGSLTNMDPDLSSSIGRIITGIGLLIIYKRAFTGQNPLKNPVIVLPSLLFPVWNLYYNLSSGAKFGGIPVYTKAFITALAPALFEEVLFRGIFIYNLRKNNRRDMSCLFISAAFFAAIHLTNLLGGNIVGTALQLAYSFVIGLALAAVYLKNNSILQIIFVHFLIDFTNRIYIDPASTAGTVHIIVIALLLIAETVWSIWLTGRKEHTAG